MHDPPSGAEHPVATTRGRLHEAVGLLLGAVVLGAFLVVLGTSDRFPSVDGTFTLHVSDMVAKDLFGWPPTRGLHHLATLSKPHPPLAYLPSVLLIHLLPLRWVIAACSALSVALLLDALVRIGRPLPPWGSIMVGALGLGAGLTWWSADHYGFDLAGAAAVLQTLSWLVVSEGLRRRREALLFGVWLGVTFLTKYSAPMPLVLPVLVVCGIALFRQPRGVLRAVGGWALVTGPWLLVNASRMWGYAISSVTPSDNPANHQTAMSFSERLTGPGWELVSGALADAYGLPLLILGLASALLARRWTLLLAALSGFVVLATYNNPHGRHTLPLLFVIAAAAIPRIPQAASTGRKVLSWSTVLIVATFGTITFVGSASTYNLKGLWLPSSRPFTHSFQAFRKVAPWPFPAEQFMPLNQDVNAWRMEALNRLVAQHAAGAAHVIFFPGTGESPGLSAYNLVASQHDIEVAWFEAHTRLDRNGQPEIETMIPRDINPRYAYVLISGKENPAGERWLASVGHQELGRIELPRQHTGVLVVLDTPFVPADRWTEGAYRGGRFGPAEPPR